MKKIFITGGSGLLALNWAAHINSNENVMLGIHKKQVSPSFAKTIPFEMLDRASIDDALDLLSPEVVIHTTGLTNVEVCEKNPDLAYSLNVETSAKIASACASRNIKLVFVSTDHLFSGSKAIVDETEAVCPVNVYGRTKAEGEKVAQDLHADVIIMRTNFFCWGPSYRKSFSDTIYDALRSGETISLFNDVFFTPLLASTAFDILNELIEIDAKGVFNVCGNERLSKYDFGMRLANIAGLNTSGIKATKLLKRSDLVRRPLDMSLSNLKVTNLIKQSIGDLDHCIEKLFDQVNQKNIKEIRSL